jgi:hypothetical protein
MVSHFVQARIQRGICSVLTLQLLYLSCTTQPSSSMS